MFARFASESSPIMERNKAMGSSQLPQCLSSIYSGTSTCPACTAALTPLPAECSKMLRSLEAGGHLACPVQEAQANAAGLTVPPTAVAVMRDLIVATSTMCVASAQHVHMKKLRSPACVIIALAPYWAVAALITQLDHSPTHHTLQGALQQLLQTTLTRTAAVEVSEDLLLVLPAAAGRLRAFALGPLSSPLLFATQLALAMRSALEVKLLCPQCPAFMAQVLEQSDANTSEVVQLIALAVPQLALQPDRLPSRALPLAYAASFRSTLSSSPAPRLSLQLTAVLAQACPSAAAIADSTGKYALHYAAASGHGETLQMLTTMFPYTAPLKDKLDVYPLQRALLRSAELGDAAVLSLCAAHPQALFATSKSRPVDLLACARSKCSAALFEGLMAIAQQVKRPAPLIPKVKKTKAKLIASPRSTCSADSDCGASHALDTDNESLSDSSMSAGCHSPLREEESDALLQYAASLLMLQRGDSPVPAPVSEKRALGDDLDDSRPTKRLCV